MDQNRETQIEEAPFGCWAVVELMGHVKMAGYVSEVELFGTKLGRIDVPAGAGEMEVTQYFGASAVFRITPVTEGMARAMAEKLRPRPIHRYELALSPGMAKAFGGWDDQDDSPF